MPCRLQGIKTSEIYSSLDWSGLTRFGVASSKKGAILLVTSNEGAAALQGYAELLFVNFNKTVSKAAAHNLPFYYMRFSILDSTFNGREKDVYLETKRP